MRAGFRVLLETEDAFQVCGEAADGAEAITLARRHRPDVVVMDVVLAYESGLVKPGG